MYYFQHQFLRAERSVRVRVWPTFALPAFAFLYQRKIRCRSNSLNWPDNLFIFFHVIPPGHVRVEKKGSRADASNEEKLFSKFHWNWAIAPPARQSILINWKQMFSLNQSLWINLHYCSKTSALSIPALTTSPKTLSFWKWSFSKSFPFTAGHKKCK